MRFFAIAIFSLLNIGYIHNSFSQNFIDLFNCGTSYSPHNLYKDFNNKVNIAESYANFRIPVQLENKNVLIYGLNLNSIIFNNVPKIIEDENLYSTSLEFGYSKYFNEKLNTLLALIPKISSDFKNIYAEDYQIGGLLLFTYKNNEKLKLKFGTYYNKEFFGNFFVPLIGIDWHPFEEIQIFGNLPVNLTCEFSLHELMAFGVYFKSSVSSYRLGEEHYKAYTQRTYQELSVFYDFYLTKNIVLTIKAGHTFGRYYRTYSENDKLKMKIAFYNIGDNRNKLNYDIKDGFLYEIKLSYRLSI
jgi:hypothetical protein